MFYFICWVMEKYSLNPKNAPAVNNWILFLHYPLSPGISPASPPEITPKVMVVVIKNNGLFFGFIWEEGWIFINFSMKVLIFFILYI